MQTAPQTITAVSAINDFHSCILRGGGGGGTRKGRRVATQAVRGGSRDERKGERCGKVGEREVMTVL